MILVKSLSKSYGKTRAVKDVSFTVRQGEAVVLLGPNGSGKSTTLKAIMRVIIPDSGEISVNGLPIVGNPRSVGCLISYLPQVIQYPDNLKVAEILELIRKVRGLSTDDVRKALFEMGIGNYADEYVSNLSGGTVQRLGVAIALLPDSPILILDEPTASLDPEGVMHFKGLLKKLREQGKTILFTTHLLNEVDELADNVGILMQGRLIIYDNASSLKKKLSIQTKVYAVIKNLSDEHINTTLRAGALEARRNGTTVLFTAESNRIADVIHALMLSGAVIDNLQTSNVSFEQVYATLVKSCLSPAEMEGNQSRNSK